MSVIVCVGVEGCPKCFSLGGARCGCFVDEVGICRCSYW